MAVTGGFGQSSWGGVRWGGSTIAAPIVTPCRGIVADVALLIGVVSDRLP